MPSASDRSLELVTISPVLPVVVVDALDQAVSTARALAAGGIPVVELTLRTPVALDAIRAISAEVPQVTIGAGTVTSRDTVKQAVEAGAQFLVSPGCTPTLLAAMRESGLPFLPGTATVSEAIAVLETGHRAMKFFPAEASGGAAYLSALPTVIPDAVFCPTGGVSAANASTYLALPNVSCVGGSWLTPKDALAAGDWERVADLAAAAAALR
ncbi:bifunctional 4-hydroxy-2-oxoglutarate aldolase/2-dehydro-3-deoxy-phosphogluconate aldolase [Nocardioides sp. KR10-350]|uniref:bifunctional 4-hydroxy-2-oxoglutarate aldolase/2-dehydro-3-deoxy-phosphogluconate aldolase n=1 Tax=Nocardioides cheoyonin TaxID=3156615 RepID=UPI0032B4D776